MCNRRLLFTSTELDALVWPNWTQHTNRSVALKLYTKTQDLNTHTHTHPERCKDAVKALNVTLYCMGFRDPCPFETEIVLEGPFGRAHLQLWPLPACQRILRLFSPLKMDGGAWANVQKHGPTMDFGFPFCVCYCYTSGVSCTACCCKQNTCLRTCLHEHRMWYTCPDKHVREVFFLGLFWKLRHVGSYKIVSAQPNINSRQHPAMMALIDCLPNKSIPMGSWQPIDHG